MTTTVVNEPSKASVAFSKSLGRWLVIFGEMCRLPVSELLANVYAEALKDLTVEQLEAACIAVVRAHQVGRLPLPGDILAKVHGAHEDAKLLEAERIWNWLQQCIDDHGLDESTGWFMRTFCNGKWNEPVPEFSAATEYAVRQCGGLRAVIYCSDRAFPFMRKDFIAAYLRYRETGGLQVLGKAESRAILGKIRRTLLAAKQDK